MFSRLVRKTLETHSLRSTVVKRFDSKARVQKCVLYGVDDSRSAHSIEYTVFDSYKNRSLPPNMTSDFHAVNCLIWRSFK